MSVSRIKNWIVETLTASDLNAEFNNILDNGEDLAWPATKAKDLNGQELILDADADTSITADTDDQIDFKIAGANDFKMSANRFTVLSGSSYVQENGILHIGGDALNADMTLGLTIDQGVADDHILTLKSSDVDHARTGLAETDTFFSITKSDPTQGGVLFEIIAEDDTMTSPFQMQTHGGTAQTNKTTAARGLIDFTCSEHDGANAVANVTDDGNIFVVRRRIGGANSAAFVVDEDGDLFADDGTSTTAVTVFDGEDDIALCRAFDLRRADRDGLSDQIVRQEWDDWANKHRDRLVDLRVMAADGPNGEHGLVNVTQLQRLHNGAICQLHTALMKTQERLVLAERKLAALPTN